MLEFSIISAFFAGLLGGVHCLGMCGGIAMSLTFTTQTPWRFLLFYNLGRIGTYSLLGLLAGSVGASLWRLPWLQSGLLIFSGIFMILLGLYLANINRWLAIFEQIGQWLTPYLSPLARRLLPVKHLGQAFFLGMIWGLLPCGLVYSMMIFAMTSNDLWQGGLILLSFGFGTLPNLLLIGSGALFIRRFLQEKWLKVIAGLSVFIFGVYQILLVWWH